MQINRSNPSIAQAIEKIRAMPDDMLLRLHRAARECATNGDRAAALHLKNRNGGRASIARVKEAARGGSVLIVEEVIRRGLTPH